MKIAYIDCQLTDFHEDYSVNAMGYGGGTCFAKYAKYLWPNFTLFTQKESLSNFLEWEKESSNFRELSSEECSRLRGGDSLPNVIKNINEFDIVIHHHDNFSFNKMGFNGKEVHWSLMGNKSARKFSDFSLIYNDEEDIDNGFLKVQIGKYVPEVFQESKKEGFIFQCSRHDKFMGSIELAKICLQNNIKCVFAGRIMGGYPLLDFIDNKTTFFIDSISEFEKLEYLKRASAFGLLCDWTEMPFNQSIIEALSCGTPVLTNSNNFTRKIIKSGVNGFFVDGIDFLEKFNNCHDLEQKQCWESAHKFSHINMLKSFSEALSKIK